MAAGLILTCVGGPVKNLRYKSSRRENSLFDQLIGYLTKNKPDQWNRIPFSPLNGSDERQYCAPGFNLPMGQISRTVYGEYDGYHNSLDDKETMTIESLIKSANQVEELLKMAETSIYPINQAPYGEPQLGKRNLYPNINSSHTWMNSSDEKFDSREVLNRLLTLLNYADGENTLYAIATKCDCTIDDLQPIINRLVEEKLIKMERSD